MFGVYLYHALQSGLEDMFAEHMARPGYDDVEKFLAFGYILTSEFAGASAPENSQANLDLLSLPRI